VLDRAIVSRDGVTVRAAPGRLRVGTSGFAYPDWSPTFYPVGTPPSRLLATYARRLDACELNNTFYRRPSRDRLRAWRSAVPPEFRFVVKAQRGSSLRALRGDPGPATAWVTEGLDELGANLGAMLFRIPAVLRRDDQGLAGLLAAWPGGIPLVLELQDPSWHVDETFAAARSAGAVLCATDIDGLPDPDLRVTGPFIYLRLRRAAYDPAAIEAWAGRLAPFLAAGLDAFVFLRHDETGESALAAESLARATAGRLERDAAS
jgi:uncharacterized protein YecE (DUF72 family)